MKFYITTTLPYVNAKPHIGFAMEIIRADVIARYHRLIGDEVIFNTGTDEHGQKIYQKATEEHKDPQVYCDEHAEQFKNLKQLLHVSYTNFIRTTDPSHIKAAQEFWNRCYNNGDIYKTRYEIKYCVGCELEKTDSELIDGKCPIHPNQQLETYNEENYFFKFSRYEKPLLEFYNNNPEFVIPGFRFEEIKKFVQSGLKDFSISRLKEKMPWGVPVPHDDKHVMYVWFDALVNYISTLGWPSKNTFDEFWPGIQIAGKDNLRQQSAMWQAMLLSAKLPNSKQIYIEGFITSEGQKMSKSLGNVVDPIDLVNKYTVDPVRYYLLREIPSYDDGDFSEKRFKELYNADLANNFGNLVSRTAKLIEINKVTFQKEKDRTITSDVQNYINAYRFDKALETIFLSIKKLNELIDKEKLWEKKADHFVWNKLVDGIRQVAYDLQPFLPNTAESVITQFQNEKIISQKPLFPRLSM